VAPSKRLTRNTAALALGAPVKNLAHSASLQLLDKTAPSKFGIKHLAVTPAIAFSSHATEYAATILPSLAGGGDSQVEAVNNSGEIAGYSWLIAGGVGAALWPGSGIATALSDAGGQGVSIANAINESGQTAGYSATANGGEAVLWSPTGKATVLQDAGGKGSSTAVALNASGQSAGYSKTAKGYDAVLWSPTGKATVLQDAGGNGYSQADAINASGQSVGYSVSEIGYYGEMEHEAVLWSPSGKSTVLENEGGQSYSEAFAVNDAGQSVGISMGEWSKDAVLWSPTGKATLLQDVGGWAVDQPHRHQRRWAERRMVSHRKRQRRGPVVAVGDGDRSRRHTRTGLEQYDRAWDQRPRRHLRGRRFLRRRAARVLANSRP
jgi:hypothetical protein